MQKISIFLAALLFIVLSVEQVSAFERAGTVERQKGNAISTRGGESVGLRVGSTIYVGDKIQTADGARLLVRFDDASTLQMGAAAVIDIDEMVYEAAGSANRQGLKFVEGVFRYVSGAIAKESFTQVAINTPVATIGIRGTDFVAGRLTVGMPPGTSHYGYQIRDGAIEVIAPGGSVTLDTPGEGTFLPFGRVAAPTPVRQWTAAEAQEADNLLAF
ncbi:MAG: FecR domain-containing protein [Rhodospirillales bacterium]|nr:FecR domain-containing protein [Rhodospirillales bacterium]MBO6788609.1 FecR domain-containing protein [Rhodospirillales bacterium]